jgi:hypothetical protein
LFKFAAPCRSAGRRGGCRMRHSRLSGFMLFGANGPLPQPKSRESGPSVPGKGDIYGSSIARSAQDAVPARRGVGERRQRSV